MDNNGNPCRTTSILYEGVISCPAGKGCQVSAEEVSAKKASADPKNLKTKRKRGTKAEDEIRWEDACQGPTYSNQTF